VAVNKKFDFSVIKHTILYSVEEKLLTKKEVQEYLRISQGTLEKKIMKEIPYIKLGRRVLFRKSDIEAYINKKTIKNK
jgi:excisionase family DNA binding protein